MWSINAGQITKCLQVLPPVTSIQIWTRQHSPEVDLMAEKDSTVFCFWDLLALGAFLMPYISHCLGLIHNTCCVQEWALWQSSARWQRSQVDRGKGASVSEYEREDTWEENGSDASQWCSKLSPLQGNTVFRSQPEKSLSHAMAPIY